MKQFVPKRVEEQLESSLNAMPVVDATGAGQAGNKLLCCELICASNWLGACSGRLTRLAGFS